MKDKEKELQNRLILALKECQNALYHAYRHWNHECNTPERQKQIEEEHPILIKIDELLREVEEDNLFNN